MSKVDFSSIDPKPMWKSKTMGFVVVVFVTILAHLLEGIVSGEITSVQGAYMHGLAMVADAMFAFLRMSTTVPVKRKKKTSSSVHPIVGILMSLFLLGAAASLNSCEPIKCNVFKLSVWTTDGSTQVTSAEQEEALPVKMVRLECDGSTLVEVNVDSVAGLFSSFPEGVVRYAQSVESSSLYTFK